MYAHKQQNEKSKWQKKMREKCHYRRMCLYALGVTYTIKTTGRVKKRKNSSSDKRAHFVK
jgi:hypothetical protein